MNEKFTKEYFRSEVLALRDAWGHRDFWQGEKCLDAFKGLLFVYTNVEHLDLDDITLMNATTDEFNRRHELMGTLV